MTTKPIDKKQKIIMGKYAASFAPVVHNVKCILSSAIGF